MKKNEQDNKENELKQFRTLNSRHILKKDKTIDVEIYNENIHYLNNNEYEEIDNSLVKTSKGFKNKANDFKIEFNTIDKDNLITITKRNENKLTFSLENQNDIVVEYNSKKGIKKVDKIDFKNVLNNIDLSYEIRPNKLKEKIILNKIAKEIKFKIKTDLQLELNKNNSISVKNNKKTIYEIDRPFMIDSNNEISEEIEYILNENDKGYELIIKPNQEWLNESKRKYPIVIDPTVNCVENARNIQDTYIFDGDNNTTTYNRNYLIAGKYLGDVYRTLIKFNLPIIPASYKLTDAKLTLYSYPEYDIYGKNRQIFSIHKITRDWNESTVKWADIYNRYTERIYDFFRVSRSEGSDVIHILGQNDINLTELVKEWYNNPNSNYGIMIKQYIESETEDIESEDETGENRTNSVASFISSNMSSDVGLSPMVLITFKNYNGLDSYQSYSTQSHFFGNSNISNFTGNLTTIFEVANTIGGPLPANLYLTYNTYDVTLNNDYGYGLGVKPNLLQFVETTNYSHNPLAYTNETGAIHYFYDYDSSGIYKDEDGLGLTLQLDSENEDIYIMTDKDDNKYNFINHNGKYYLEEIKDTNGKTITIELNESMKITKVTDSTNHDITITYNQNNIIFTSPYKTTTINLNNNLISSITSLGDTEIINYTSNNLIEELISPNGLKIKYEYTNDLTNKVSKVIEYGSDNEEGNYLEFTYELSDTKVEDKIGCINTYIFNDNGNVVGITALDETQKLENAYGKTFSFGTNESDVNKLTADRSLVKYIDNLVDDPSFEKTDNINNVYNCVGVASTCVITDRYEARTGSKVLEVDFPRAGEEVYRYFNVPKGKTYTLSMYLKTVNPLEAGEQLSLELGYDNENTEIILNSLNDEYTRYSLTIDYPESAQSDLKFTIRGLNLFGVCVAIDDMQLETGEVTNYYNIIDDQFEGWTDDSGIDNPVLGGAYYQFVTLNNNERAIKIHSTPQSNLVISKNIDIEGVEGDVFNLSFWYKNNGIIPSYQSGIGESSFYATIKMYYDDPELGMGVITKPFNVGDNNWQFFSENFYAEGNYNRIEIIIFAEHNANDCWVTNFTLFKDLTQYSYTYDDNGNLISATDLAKETSTMSYNKNNQLLESISPMGNNFKFEYDNNVVDRLLSATSTTGITNPITYDENCNPIKTKINNRKTFDPIDNTKTYYIRAKGTNKYFYVNPDKTLKVKTNECSYDKFYIIKDENEKIKFKHAVLNNYYLKKIDNNILLTYGNYDNEFEIITNLNNSYSIIVPDSDPILSFCINDNNAVTLEPLEEDEYNEQFFFEQSENKLFIESSATYTSDGRFVSSVTDNLGNTINYDYNDINGLVNSITDPNSSVTNYTYDNKLRITQIQKGNHRVNYQYNNRNLLSNILFGTDNYEFNYDNFNNIHNIKINNNTLVTNTYEPHNGNLSKVTYGNNAEINYTYDKLDRLESIIKENNTYTNYYDNLGRIAKLISNNDTYLYEYDFAKRLSTFRYSNYTSNYKYNNDNLVTKKIDQLLSTEYKYDYEYNRENALTKLTNNNKEFNYDYDILGRLSSQNINNNHNISYKYITNGNKTSTQIEEVNDNGTIYNYTYDKLGNITEIRKDDILTNKYYYDEYSELIKEDNYITNKTITYTYDNYGNILSKKTYTINTTNLLNEDTYTYGNTNWQDQLTRFNNTNITYDNIGNPLSIGNKTITWMNGRELHTYSDGTNNITYNYNLEGIRTSKIVNGIETKYYLEGNNIIFEDRNGTMIYYIYNGNDVLGFVYNNNTYYYHKNIFGDIIGILDSNYNEIVTYTYDSWGRRINTTDTSNINLSEINPFRYKSYYYDNETQLYYLNSRYYNPEWGRFINADSYISTGQGILGNNMYAYCGDCPIVKKDLVGDFWEFALLVVGAGILTGIVCVVAQIDSNKIKGEENIYNGWSGAFISGVFSGITFVLVPEASPFLLAFISTSLSMFANNYVEGISYNSMLPSTTTNFVVSSLAGEYIPDAFLDPMTNAGLNYATTLFTNMIEDKTSTNIKNTQKNNLERSPFYVKPKKASHKNKFLPTKPKEVNNYMNGKALFDINSEIARKRSKVNFCIL